MRPGETPSFFIYQDWALGLLFLKMGVRLLDAAFPVPALPLPPEDLQYEVRPCKSYSLELIHAPHPLAPGRLDSRDGMIVFLA